VRRTLGVTFALAAIISGVAAGNAGARGPTNEFTVGSAKTDVEVVVVGQHASFSAHNTGAGCGATGQIVYDEPTLGFTAKIDTLVVMGQAAYFGGQITKVVRGPVTVGDGAYFDAFDSQQPGGLGDQFRLDVLLPSPTSVCLPPELLGVPITSGNIVIHA
jgi:hypothetical protein